MQNPFRHRPQDDFGRQDPERDDQRWEARDRRLDEGRSWTEGDGGRIAEAYRNQGQYGREERDFSGSRWGYGPTRQGEYGGWSGDRIRAGGSYDQYGYGNQPARTSWGENRADYGAEYGRGGMERFDRPERGELRHLARERGWETQRGQGGYFGRHEPDHGYAPGSQIWESQDRDYGGRGRFRDTPRDFEPDYLHWREQQLSNFDRDYTEWRNEKRQRFSADFDTWRQTRPRTEATHRQADNPIVGDVSDGGTGNAKDAKTR
jgi:hypothetical protein